MFVIPDISRQHKIALGFGFLAMFFANQSLNAIATPYFQMTLGLDPFKLSLVLAGPIMFAAFISRTAGQWSDCMNTSKGSRRLSLLVSGVMSGILFGAIWMVPSHWGENAILAYLLVLNFLFCISLTFLTINVKSLAFELSHDSEQRVKVMAFGSMFERIGSFAYFWLFPLAQWSLWGSVYFGVQYVGWFIGIVLIGMFSVVTAWFSVLPVALVKSDVYKSKTQPAKCEVSDDCECKQTSVNDYAVDNKNNDATELDVAEMDSRVKRALFLLLSLILIKFGAISIFTSLDFYLLVYFVKAGDLEAGAAWKGILSSTFACVTLVIIPLFSYLTLKLGKLKTLYLIYWLSALGALLKWFIYQPGNEWAVVVDALLGAPSWVAISVIIPSMLADLCAYDRHLSGQNRVGYFISMQNKVINFGVVGTMIGAGLLLNLIGFDAELGGHQNPDTIMWMRICLAGGPLLLCFLSLIIVKNYPFPESFQAVPKADNALQKT